jgi:hypothetical protein
VTKAARRPDRETLADWCLMFGIVLLLVGLVLIVGEVGPHTAIFGGSLIAVSQVLHPFWRPKWKPEPSPPQPTLGDFGIAPKKGERFTASEPVKVEVIVWCKPMGNYTLDGELRAGTLVISDLDHEPHMNVVYVSAAEHVAMESLLVPEGYRNAGNYNGYSLYVAPADFEKRFTRF